MDTIWNHIIKEYKGIMEQNPVLTAQEEVKLFTIIKSFKGGIQKQRAREKMFNSNLKLVLEEVYRYIAHCTIPIEDMVQAGNEGLVIAIDRFDLSFKTKFSTYATPWIRLKIFNVMKDFNSDVYVPCNISDKFLKYKRILTNNEADPLTQEDLMTILKVNEKGLKNIKMAQVKSFSLSHVYPTQQGGNKCDNTLANIIPDNKNKSPMETLIKKEKGSIIRRFVDGLKPIYKAIIISRYLESDTQKLDQIGKKFRLTGERIRQIEVQALRKLRKRMKSRERLGV